MTSIYHLFVEQAMNLEPRFLVMVIPSRWLAGGRDMGSFRQRMFTDGHIREFVDYTKMNTAFPASILKEVLGISYGIGKPPFPVATRFFLAMSNFQRWNGIWMITTFLSVTHDHLKYWTRSFLKGEATLDSVISGDTPFGLATNFANHSPYKSNGTLQIYLTLKGESALRPG